MYLFGAYIRKYDIKDKTTPAKSILGFLAMVLLTLGSKAIIRLITKSTLGYAKSDELFISYTSITIILSSINMLLFCLTIRINTLFYRIIAFFAPATLGVYLIHVHPFVFELMLKDAFITLSHETPVILLLHTVGIALVIFLLCSAIDLLRIRLFKLIRVDKLSEYLDSIISRK